MRQVAGDDLVQVQVVPQPAGQPHIAEAAAIGPTHGVQTNAHDVGIVGQGDGVVGKEAELLGLALAVMEDDGALPAALLVVIEFTEVGDDLLAGTGVGAHTLDQGIVGMLLAVFGPGVAAEEHRRPLVLSSMTRGRGANQEGRSSLHRLGKVSTTGKQGVFAKSPHRNPEKKKVLIQTCAT